MMGNLTSSDLRCAGCRNHIHLPGTFTVVGSDWYHPGCAPAQATVPDPRIAELEAEIGRLRTLFRVNMLRLIPPSSHDQIDVMLDEARNPPPRVPSDEDRFRERIAQIRLRSVFTTVRRMAAPEYSNEPNWAIAMDLFAIGSTYANMLCRQMLIEPDATTVKHLIRYQPGDTPAARI